MLIVDVIVIYLTCGAPFAVGRFLERGAYFDSRHVLTSFGAMLYWPVLVPAAIGRISGREKSGLNSRVTAGPDPREELLRSSLTRLWSEAFGPAGLNRFRTELERYVAISLELAAHENPSEANELISIAGHPDPVINNLCLARLNRRKLELHRIDARNEFITAVERLVSAGRHDAVTIAEQLAEAVGDGDALAEMALFAPCPNINAAAA